jgi:hypothetical protein
MRDKSGQDQELDILLDAALATYTSPEPSPGLTARILAATRVIDRHPPVRWMVWAVPALAATLFITIVLIHRAAAPRAPSQPAGDLSASRGSTPTRPTQPAHSVVETPSHLRRPQTVTTRSIPTVVPMSPSLPRQDVFPTSIPLSPQEQALVALVNRDSPDSKDLAQQITQPDSQGQPIELLRIAAIHIPPLNPPDHGDN